MKTDSFVERHLGPTKTEVQEMLKTIGVDNLDTYKISLMQDFAGFMDEAKIFVQEDFDITVK